MKLYRFFAILFLILGCLGLVSFVGGMRSVNAGVFVFPFVLSLLFWMIYRKNNRP